MNRGIFILFFSLSLFSCTEKRSGPTVPFPKKIIQAESQPTINPDEYRNKVLGALVGSVIGDAMGAPVEMWDRNQIRDKYQWIDGLVPVARTKSPEGTWQHNMPAGSTTDDTRWKFMYTQFLTQSVTHRDTLLPDDFAEFILTAYQNVLQSVADTENVSAENTDDLIAQIHWLQEWALVAEAYQKEIVDYNRKLNKFYGGEMSCAGMLYAPMIGLAFPGQLQKSYTQAFDTGLFDIGYAKDITALTAAMTAKAMMTSSTDSILNLVNYLDPYDYTDSRLIGRLTQNFYATARSIVATAKNTKTIPSDQRIIIPDNWTRDSLSFYQIEMMYKQLDRHLKAIPFHAGEIFIIALTAMEYAQGDFKKAMTFITNYGRDNDTAAAVAGMIMGAQLGYDQLPEKMKVSVVQTSQTVIGIDLEALSDELTRWYFAE